MPDFTGRLKLTYPDNSSSGENTLGSDTIKLSAKNVTKSLNYPEQEGGTRAGLMAYLNNVVFAFADKIFSFYRTCNKFEARESELSLAELTIPQNETVTISSVTVTPTRVTLAYTDNSGTGIALATDRIYTKVTNTSTSSLRNKMHIGGFGARADGTATGLSLGSIGAEGDSVDLLIGLVSTDNKYSEEVARTAVVVVADTVSALIDDDFDGSFDSWTVDSSGAPALGWSLRSPSEVQTVSTGGDVDSHPLCKNVSLSSGLDITVTIECNITEANLLVYLGTAANNQDTLISTIDSLGSGPQTNTIMHTTAKAFTQICLVVEFDSGGESGDFVRIDSVKLEA